MFPKIWHIFGFKDFWRQDILSQNVDWVSKPQTHYKMYRIKRITVVCYFLKLLPLIKENFNQRNLQGVPTGNPFNLLSAHPPPPTPFPSQTHSNNSSAKADELIVLSVFDHLVELVLKGLMTNNISLDYNYGGPASRPIHQGHTTKKMKFSVLKFIY